MKAESVIPSRAASRCNSTFLCEVTRKVMEESAITSVNVLRQLRVANPAFASLLPQNSWSLNYATPCWKATACYGSNTIN
jgi:hypothetical protein